MHQVNVPYWYHAHVLYNFSLVIIVLTQLRILILTFACRACQLMRGKAFPNNLSLPGRSELDECHDSLLCIVSWVVKVNVTDNL